MSLKLTRQGALIYVAMAAYLAALVAMLAGKENRRGRLFFFVGFVCAVLAFAYRGYHTGHVPMQNMFEVFLCLGMLAWPLSFVYRRLLGLEGELIDVITGCVILFPAGFVFSAEPQKLPPALQSWLFAPHVATYMLSYMVLIRAGIQGADNLLSGKKSTDTARIVKLGFPLLTFGLLLGAWWAKIAWGDYWNWDPKEMWSLATWLVYVSYFHVGAGPQESYKRMRSGLAVVGAVCTVLTLLWVNLASQLFAGLHTYAT